MALWLTLTPRQKPAGTCGLRIEWSIIPDQATAAAALANGEVDWQENLLLDLAPHDRESTRIAYIPLAPVMQLTAIIKAVIVFILTLAISWAATAVLRRIPGATHVL